MTKTIKLALLIDDNKIDQRIYQRVINQSGLVDEVLSFTFADEALAYLQANRDLVIDVIFLDINMPRMNGFEFLEQATEQLGKEFARVVVAMLTTSLNPDDRKLAETFDKVKCFINKPLTIEHIQQIADICASTIDP